MRKRRSGGLHRSCTEHDRPVPPLGRVLSTPFVAHAYRLERRAVSATSVLREDVLQFCSSRRFGTALTRVLRFDWLSARNRRQFAGSLMRRDLLGVVVLLQHIRNCCGMSPRFDSCVFCSMSLAGQRMPEQHRHEHKTAKHRYVKSIVNLSFWVIEELATSLRRRRIFRAGSLSPSAHRMAG